MILKINGAKREENFLRCEYSVVLNFRGVELAGGGYMG